MATTEAHNAHMFEMLGKHCLRYICLHLPTLQRFSLLRVCKTFHSFLTLPVGAEDTPDPPSFDIQLYQQYASMQLVLDEELDGVNSNARSLRTSVTDEADVSDDASSPVPSANGLEDNKAEQQLLWNELLKAEAMVQHVDEQYECRLDLSRKMQYSMRQLTSSSSSSESAQTHTSAAIGYHKDGTTSMQMSEDRDTTVDILDDAQKYRHTLWLYACDLGDERQALDEETRTLVQCGDEQLFYTHIMDEQLYKENGTIHLCNGGFLRASSLQLRAISYFLMFQHKLQHIYTPHSVDDLEENSFFLVVTNLTHLNIANNDDTRRSSKPEADTRSSSSFVGLSFLRILSSEFSQLLALELTQCGLTDSDVEQMCSAWCTRQSHSSLQSLSLAENACITDDCMAVLFTTVANYLGNLLCLMLHETGITDKTCELIFKFYKAQFSSKMVKHDAIAKDIDRRYNIENFERELQRMKTTQSTLKWQHHKDEELEQFMLEIADDFGVIHEYYPHRMDANSADATWEQCYQKILQRHNLAFSAEMVMDAFERKIQCMRYEKEQALERTPFLKKRSKLKQLRLHLNASITGVGFNVLNDIFKKGYLHKKDAAAAILIDGYVEDVHAMHHYQQWLAETAQRQREFESLGEVVRRMEHNIKDMKEKLVSADKKRSSEQKTSLSAKCKHLQSEKEKLINKRFELHDLIETAKTNQLSDPKRDRNWDKRLLTTWSNVWDNWTDPMEYENVI